MLMAPVLSHLREIGLAYFTSKSARDCIIHSTCVQHVATTMYSAYVVDKSIKLCFLLNHATKESPKNNEPMLVLFLSSKQLAQSSSE